MNRNLWIALGAIIALSFLAEFTQEAHHWWENIPGFYIIFGFIGAMALILISRYLGKLFIQKNEDYYDVQ